MPDPRSKLGISTGFTMPLPRGGWNHNTHYHALVLSTVPHPCILALDVGCGHGMLTQELAPNCLRVLGIDSDPDVVAAAMSSELNFPNVSFVQGDVMTYPFPASGFTFITAVATLHHLPLEAGLKRFAELLAPGGVLTIIGLYRSNDLEDSLFALAGRTASWTLRWFRNLAEMKAPMHAPRETLSDIRIAATGTLPGSIVKRRLFFRYSLTWVKPHADALPRHR